MRRVILAIIATAAALVLLLSFKTRPQPAAPGTAPAAALGSPAPGGTGTSTGSSSTGSSSTGGAGAPAGGPGQTVTGRAWPTVYGPVQVKITVAGGRITAATAVRYPADTPRDQQINAFAIPRLNQEAVTAGSAKIDTVSGATYTSGGYIASLQSALDQAGAS